MLNYLSSAYQGRSPIGISFPPLSVKHIVSYQLSSVTQSCPTLDDPIDCSRPGFPVITNSWSLLKLMSIESVMPSYHLILCRPLLLLPSVLPSIRVFSNESALSIRWPSGSFSFSISPSNEYSGLIPFRIDWFDLLPIQGTLKSILQPHSSKASILQCLAFFMFQLSHPYMTTRKTIALTRWNFVGKVMSLFFNMLSRFVIAFLPRSKHLLISWLQSPFAVILEPPKIKTVTVSIVSPSICHDMTCLDAGILVFWMLSFKLTFSLSTFTFIKRLFSSSAFCRKGGAFCVSEVVDISPGNLLFHIHMLYNIHCILSWKYWTKHTL